MNTKLPTKAKLTLSQAKFLELEAVLPFLYAETGVDADPCGCCLKTFPVFRLNCLVLEDGPRLARTWVCRHCSPAAIATDFRNVKQAIPVTMQEIEEMLASAAKVVDAAILKRNNFKPFVRRPTCAEILCWNKEGHGVARNYGVVVTLGDEGRPYRRFLPFSFLWRDDAEWMVGSTAAREVAALADAIGRGDVEVTVFLGGFSVVSMDEGEFADALLKSGNTRDLA